MEVIDVDDFQESALFSEAFGHDHMQPRYRAFQREEGIPVHDEFYIADINETETGPWDRTGERGAFVNMHGTEGYTDLQIQEISPGGRTDVQRHFWEELVWVSKGEGGVELLADGGRVFFEWSRDALFCIPPNVPFRYYNHSQEATARVVSQTTLPQVVSLLPDTDFLFECEYDFLEADAADDSYSAEGVLYAPDESPMHRRALTWESNFLPDMRTFSELDAWGDQGAGAFVMVYMPEVSQWVHISELPPGQYKKAHRHGPGAHLVFLSESAEGYSLMWREDWDVMAKVPFGPRSVYSPPAHWYHHHFNTAPDPVRYFAYHYPDIGTLRNTCFSTAKPRNYLDYGDEPAVIREHFEDVLSGKGLGSAMPAAAYEDPKYEFEV